MESNTSTAEKNPLKLQLEANPGEWAIEQQLFDILTAYLPATSTLTAQQAAERFNTLFPPNRPDDGSANKESPGSFLAEFWDLLFRVAAQLDYDGEPMRRFVAAVRALRELPEAVNVGGLGRVWTDLPYMGVSISERWNRLSVRDPGTDAETLRRWANMHGLCATLAAEGLHGLRDVLGSIAVTLETKDRRKGKDTSHLVPAAAVGFIVAAPAICEVCRAEKFADTSPRGNLWKGADGYSVERWAFWKARLAEIAGDAKMVDETRGRCRDAVAAMDRAEQSRGP